MTVRRAVLDTVGFLIAGLAGVPYFLFMFGRAWNGRPEVAYLTAWFVLSVLIVGAVVIVLTILLRPTRLWLYPLGLAGMILIFGLSVLQEAAGLVWVFLAAATVAAGWGWGYLTQSVVKRLRHPNGALMIDAASLLRRAFGAAKRER
jgi:hypothetical protein